MAGRGLAAPGLRGECHLTVAGLLLLMALMLWGCDIGSNPLILDGTITSADFPVDAEIPFFLPASFTVTDSIDLSRLYEGDDGVDSIKFYNLTFIAEGDTAGLAVRVSGSIDVGGEPFLLFNDVPLSVFSPGRSIFQATPGFDYDARGIARIREALEPGTTETGLRMNGTFGADSRSLHFTMRARLHTQVFLSPGN